MVKYIELTNKERVSVDAGDFEWLAQWRWHRVGKYAARWDRGRRVWMHRQINGTPKGLVTDHINGNQDDNRRSNLRSCTQSQNHMNKGEQSNNTSGHRGVYRNHHSKAEGWRAQIMVNRQSVHLGYFKTKEEARHAYLQARQELFGDFAFDRVAW